ncbi:MAG: phage holin family protein [Anaerolineales bacterium]|jgi:putative membrane protein
MKFFIHWLITVIALFVATLILPKSLMSVQGTSAWLAFAVMAIVLALVNVFIRPVLKLLSCAFIILTVGLFMLVINAFLLWFSSWICQQIGVGFFVQWPWGAFWGSIIVSVVSFVFHLFIHQSPRAT